MIGRLLLVVFALLVPAWAAQAQGIPLALFDKIDVAADRLPGHDAGFVQPDNDATRTALTAPSGTTYDIPIALPGLGYAKLRMDRFRVSDGRTEVLIRTGTTTQQTTTMPEQLFLSGSVVDRANSHAMLAIYGGEVRGWIEVVDGTARKRYVVQPYPAAGIDRATIIMDQAFADETPEWLCKQDEVDASEQRTPRPIPNQVNSRPTGKGDGIQTSYRTIAIALEGDYEYYVDHGRDIQRALAYAEAVTAAASAIYRRDVQAQIYIKRLEVWNTTDPYTGTSSDVLLGQFRDRWRSVNSAVERTTAVLLSGVNAIGGVAYLDALCNKQFGYAVVGLNNNVAYPAPGYVWDTDVYSHELGHSIGSPHTHSCQWNPPIDSCYRAEGNCYAGTKSVQGTIMSYCHLTAMGTSLQFNSRVSDLLATRLADASCVTSVSDLSVSAGRDTTICSGTFATLRGAVVGGVEPYTIEWIGPGVTTPGNATIAVAPLNGAIYAFRVTDAMGTQVTDSVMVSVATPLNVLPPADKIICEGHADQLKTTVVTGAAPLTYQWYMNGSLLPDEKQATYTYVASASFEARVVVTDRYGCSYFDDILVNVLAKPVADIDPVTISCPGDAVRLVGRIKNGRPPYSVEWFADDKDLDVVEQVVTIHPQQTTTITLIVTDRNECTDTVRMVVPVRRFVAAITPATITVPDMSVCEPWFRRETVVENTGTDTIAITRAMASMVDVTLEEPVYVIAPGERATVAARIAVPPAGIFKDTIRYVDGRCGRTYAQPVFAERHPLLFLPAPSINLGILTKCVSGIGRATTITLMNGSSQAVRVTKVSTRNGLSVGANLPVVVPPKSTSLVDLYIGDLRGDGGTVTDDVIVTYTSGSCDGDLAIGLRYDVAPYAIQGPTSVDFGAVARADAAPVTRSLAFLPNAQTSTTTLVVTDVAIDGPFETDLDVGTVMRLGRQYTVPVRFLPAVAAVNGRHTGSLRFNIDSCTDPFTVELSAMIDPTVSVVDAEVVPGTRLRHDVTADALTIVNVGALRLRIVDVRGRTLDDRSFEAGNHTVNLAGMSDRVLLVVVESADGIHTRTIVR